jgi:hypothetical protein
VICARVESDKPVGNKGAGWLHKVDTTKPLQSLKPRPDSKQTPKSVPEVLDTANRALLAELTLSEIHRENLQRRGLTDCEIHALGYKTLPPKGRRELVNRLQVWGVKLAGVPGFYLEAGHWQLMGPAGIAIPVRDTRGRIVGLQVRCDNPEGGKYKWLSSKGYLAGCSPGAPVHVAGPVSINGDFWVTEGVIKSDIGGLKLGCVVLAVPGVGNWSGVIPIVRELKPQRVIIAFDMDKNQNSAVRLHLDTLTTCLIRRGIRTFEADWDVHFKGLDDLITGSL